LPWRPHHRSTAAEKLTVALNDGNLPPQTDTSCLWHAFRIIESALTAISAPTKAPGGRLLSKQ
jgi:hypothetical protein